MIWRSGTRCSQFILFLQSSRFSSQAGIFVTHWSEVRWRPLTNHRAGIELCWPMRAEYLEITGRLLPGDRSWSIICQSQYQEQRDLYPERERERERRKQQGHFRRNRFIFIFKAHESIETFDQGLGQLTRACQLIFEEVLYLGFYFNTFIIFLLLHFRIMFHFHSFMCQHLSAEYI